MKKFNGCLPLIIVNKPDLIRAAVYPGRLKSFEEHGLFILKNCF